MSGAEPKKNDAGRRGKLIATLLYGGAIAVVTAMLSWQVIDQAYWPEGKATRLSCAEGVEHLMQILQQARRSAALPASERVTLARFREALASDWPILPTLQRKCSRDPNASRALALVERLRYAEEQGLRHRSKSVSPLREQLQHLAGQLSGGSSVDGAGQP